MNIDEWRQFLKRYSIELLKADDLLIGVPDEAISNQWLGYPPASEANTGLRNFIHITPLL